LDAWAQTPSPTAPPTFFEDLESVLRRAMDGSPPLVRPFERYHKRDVVLLGKALPLHLTFSCIDPVSEMHCGFCNKCAERQKRLRDAAIEDRTLYSASSKVSIRKLSYRR
jgi:7-cyano-7-deazaguanine synthase